ncbi:MAG: hypothetical protein JJU45_19595 [Acidimicrobiia bacterium]|nr:hypothetical protein [Acidimicrobiia bacterium]
MALKARLEAARQDYRTLPVAEAPIPEDLEPPGQRRRILAVATVVALVLAGIAGVGWWSRSEESTPLEVGPVDEWPDPDDPEPPGAVAPWSSDVTLDPAGPYVDGQVITLLVPEGFTDQLFVRQCAVLSDGPGGAGEWCDPIDKDVTDRGDPSEVPPTTSADVRVDRVVFTPTGDRDCEDPAVTCRLVVHSADGEDVASGVLRFVGDAPPRPASIEVSRTETPGVVMLTTVGVEPHPSWSELRSSHPERAAEWEPFHVSVCAFGEPRAPGPWGTNVWRPRSGERTVPGLNCDTPARATATIDRDDPSGPVEVTVPTWILGHAGWNDCRVDHCVVLISRTIFGGFEPGGGLGGYDKPFAAALLPPDMVDPDGIRPEITVLTPGPHLAGQEVTVEVSGLRFEPNAMIVVCEWDDERGCRHLGANVDDVDNGTHVIRLPDDFACPTRCFLQFEPYFPWMPPLATAPLDTGD